MKCRFCNSDNPEGKTKCEMCGRDLYLEASGASSHMHEHKTIREPSTESARNLKRTINENVFKRQKGHITDTVSEKQNLCPICHYELEDGKCRSCGYPENQSNKNPRTEDKMKINKNKETQRWDSKADMVKGRFELTPLSGKTGLPESDPIPFAGNKIELNRENTDPENSTITSKTQAIMTYNNGRWTIIDESEFRSTFVQAAREIELENGDLIFLGNQLYRFDSTTE